MSCLNCSNRYLGCHDHCNNYRKLKDKQEMIKREQHKTWDVGGYFAEKNLYMKRKYGN